jgi:replication fork clamp-binding protein CrfC
LFRERRDIGLIIGFGFGSPLESLLMLLLTSVASYAVFRFLTKRSREHNRPSRAELRQYYYEQRRRVRELAAEFDLTDEEIERKIDEELGHHDDL